MSVHVFLGAGRPSSKTFPVTCGKHSVEDLHSIPSITVLPFSEGGGCKEVYETTTNSPPTTLLTGSTTGRREGTSLTSTVARGRVGGGVDEWRTDGGGGVGRGGWDVEERDEKS